MISSRNGLHILVYGSCSENWFRRNPLSLVGRLMLFIAF
jgi:hypothetical protein